MIDSIGGVTADVVRLALDAALLRHNVIASNIANVNTPGYMRKTVSFEDQLASVRSALKSGADSRDVSALLREITPTVVTEMGRSNSGGGDVALEQEMAELAKNVVRYEALLKGLGKEMSILSVAISEGRK